MGVVRITLYDYDLATGEPKQPITAELQYDPELTLEEQGVKKVAIFCGDDVGGGNIMLPLGMLTTAMSVVMDADQKRSSAIIMPPKPNIILPN